MAFIVYSAGALNDIDRLNVIEGVEGAILVEDYPDFPKEASVHVLQTGSGGQPVHVVWGVPKGHDAPAVLVTAYRADPDRWDVSFTERTP